MSLTILVSSLPQRSYTLIVEALDLDNETSGECFPLVWHLHLVFLTSLFCLSHFLMAMLGRGYVEGQERKFILPEPPALFHMVRWVCV